MSEQGAERGRAKLRLRGRWLLITRVGWVVVSALALGGFAISLPLHYAELREICTAAIEVCQMGQRLDVDSVQVLHGLGLSLESYAIYLVALGVLAALVWSLVGLLIFTRKSSYRMALLAALALVTFGSGFSGSTDALVRAFPAWWLPNRLLAVIGFTSIILFLYLFPSGRFVPRWARWPALAWIVGDILSVFSELLPAWDARIGFVLFFVPALGSIGSQIYRYRMVSNSTERRQTKWVLFGIVAGFGTFLGLIVLINITWGLDNPRSGLLVIVSAPVMLLTIPLSIGIAILRYRLYDIDVIIRRTLVYSVLTAALALVYIGSVVLLQQLLSPFTGGSELAIVASTLAIAALFSPLRRRIQNLIDKRFYRRKYDAAKVLAAFGATARDETDLDALSAELLRVVDETMQPEFVGLWLREPDVKREA
jgi:hypothetical protein